jgi:hypothetical protein
LIDNDQVIADRRKYLEREVDDQRAQLAMSTVTTHMDKLECYTCHDTWSPHCYGCHVKVDYSSGKTGFDWTEAGHIHQRSDRTGSGE